MTVVVEKSYHPGPYVEHAFCLACGWSLSGATALMSGNNHARQQGHEVQVERRLTGTYKPSCGECGAVLIAGDHICDLVTSR